MGAEGRRFSINFSGWEQGTSRIQSGQVCLNLPGGKSLATAAKTIDFDISTIILNSLYAMPSKSGALGMILRKDERIANIYFTALKDVVKFQQAVTGF
ncbi:hypothetical protein CPLU01_16062 [Colletotrichum plurivorum]|uniref:Uncharacterized protein n=1 Tax=Colletotrichum plurivorum TaxID=2175906 RepID=A0A8H6J1M2_9PEZI|nr:hypothetical protein CPLU01_16062 [Colletotrichum plurivorum]